MQREKISVTFGGVRVSVEQNIESFQMPPQSWRSFIQSPNSELKIIVAVFQRVQIPRYYPPWPAFLAGLDVVILDEAVVVVVQIHSYSASDAAGEGRLLGAILAGPVRLPQQRVSVAGQETVEETELHRHHDEQREGEDCTQSCNQIREIHTPLALVGVGGHN